MKLATNKQAVLIGLLLIVVAISAAYLKPTKKLADSMPAVNLEKMIPAQFGEWYTDPVVLEPIISPDRKILLSKLYAQTLNRSYLDGHGTRIMLSIAYGGDQSDEMQVHRPELCYTAQGFQVERDRLDNLPTKFGSLPIKRLFAVQGLRAEPITYWITVGDKAVVLKGMEQKLAQLRYGLTGKVPDGMLVRVSSISADDQDAYRIQDDFVREMLAAMSKEDRARIAGRFEG
ncbi:MAG: EpsI family protein [Nitrosomonadales bacterium]|nr:EpsI family protein [Nitrosomonadales bacterium]